MAALCSTSWPGDKRINNPRDSSIHNSAEDRNIRGLMAEYRWFNFNWGRQEPAARGASFSSPDQEDSSHLAPLRIIGNDNPGCNLQERCAYRNDLVARRLRQFWLSERAAPPLRWSTLLGFGSGSADSAACRID